MAIIGRDMWGRFCSSDPGLSQARLAIRAAISVSIGVLVGFGVAQLTHQIALIPMLLCAVLGLNITFTVSDPTRGARALTIGLMPIPIVVGMVVAALLSPHHIAALVGFVVIMFAAVYIRRWGPRLFAYGLVGWMGYFMTMFTGLPLSDLPALLLAVAALLVVMLVLQVFIFRDQPSKVTERMLHAFRARLRAVADAGLELVEAGPDDVRATRRLHNRLIRLNEAALLIDGQLATPGSLPEGSSEEVLRHRVLASELAAGAVGTAINRLHEQQETVAAEQLSDIRQALTALRRNDPDAARAAGGRLTALGVNSGGGYASTAAAYRLGTGVVDLADSVIALDAANSTVDTIGEREFTPSILLLNGRLPGAAAIADQLGERRPRGLRGWLMGLRLTTRQAIQVALASGLAIVVGSAISERRYYWAVLACFMAFTGTATAAETVNKAVDRALGTLVGVGVAILFVDLTHGNLIAVFAVILGSVVVAFFLMRFTYALAVVFITTMVAQLYTILNEFSDGLMFLRLIETAVGAIIGCLVAVCFLPTSTGRMARLAADNFSTALADLLESNAKHLRANGFGEENPRASARAMDATLQQLLTITRPWTLPLLFGSAAPFPGVRSERRRFAMYSLLAHQARGLAREVHTTPRVGVQLAASLARVCDLLAARARALAAREPGPAAEAAQQLDAIGLTLRSWYGSTGEAPRAMLAYLRRLDETLDQLDPTAKPEPTAPAHTQKPSHQAKTASAAPPARPVSVAPRQRSAPPTFSPAPKPVAPTQTPTATTARPAPARANPVKTGAPRTGAPAGRSGPVGRHARDCARKSGTIRGVVSRPDKRPVPVTVTLVDDVGREVSRTVTGEDGKYCLTPPGPGAYLLICTPRPDALACVSPRAASVVASSHPVVRDITLPRT
ncbi:MAG TPA: FUSC family protein [Pseudonocardiaceae bacterium]|nr:FUSC family protein [Pseudonocardiaceae bacterium]